MPDEITNTVKKGTNTMKKMGLGDWIGGGIGVGVGVIVDQAADPVGKIGDKIYEKTKRKDGTETVTQEQADFFALGIILLIDLAIIGGGYSASEGIPRYIAMGAGLGNGVSALLS